MVGDLRSGERFSVAVGEEDKGPEAEIGEAGQAHPGNFTVARPPECGMSQRLLLRLSRFRPVRQPLARLTLDRRDTT